MTLRFSLVPLCHRILFVLEGVNTLWNAVWYLIGYEGEDGIWSSLIRKAFKEYLTVGFFNFVKYLSLFKTMECPSVTRAKSYFIRNFTLF